MSDYATYLQDVFIEFGPIRSRKMFGGLGLFRDGLMFGLVADDVVYLKGDAESKPLFTAAGLTPFTYMKGNKPVEMSYYSAPESIYDDPAEARRWATIAFEAARRQHKKNP